MLSYFEAELREIVVGLTDFEVHHVVLGEADAALRILGPADPEAPVGCRCASHRYQDSIFKRRVDAEELTIVTCNPEDCVIGGEEAVGFPRIDGLRSREVF